MDKLKLIRTNNTVQALIQNIAFTKSAKSKAVPSKCDCKGKRIPPVAKAPKGQCGQSGNFGQSGKAALWRKISLFVVMPILGMTTAIVYATHEKLERPPFIPYEYMRLRNKRFPWGDGNKTLFHNPHLNALPDGYED